jgi:hypothetical protein
MYKVYTKNMIRINFRAEAVSPALPSASECDDERKVLLHFCTPFGTQDTEIL